MSFLLRLAGAYVDAVLNTFYPLEQEPSMADLYANQLADKEAEEEVSTGGRVGPDDLWPETPDPIDHMIALLEDIRNLLQSSVAREEQSAAESPGEAGPPASPGHPLIHTREFHTVPPNDRVRALAVAATGLESWIAGNPCEQPTYYRETVGLLDSMSGAVVAEK